MESEEDKPLGRAGDKPPLWIPSVNGGVIASSTTEYGWRVWTHDVHGKRLLKRPEFARLISCSLRF
ncbi:hypothetical protein OIDMADRAFT_62270 [Oidiodendron maius Zn]|uniref:Uncharacterized protein n=1 Tax=Oidiodendron maius (strain Zn) TaxID=913774 RepID=A0A0C3CST2_OIDMZ|nr:hypothetical protein OIDMADRAFT_62270 [Oidiodendron maius Zn]